MTNSIDLSHNTKCSYKNIGSEGCGSGVDGFGLSVFVEL